MREICCCQLGVYIPLREFAEFPLQEDHSKLALLLPVRACIKLTRYFDVIWGEVALLYVHSHVIPISLLNEQILDEFQHFSLVGMSIHHHLNNLHEVVDE